MDRERKTIDAMLRIYCHDHHETTNDLCAECAELAEYAHARLDKCPFQEEKTTCANCPIHCYKADKRERVRAVMRYSGPRMLWHHPILTMYHFLDGRRKEPGGYQPRRKLES
jgi:hypothetical protein